MNRRTLALIAFIIVAIGVASVLLYQYLPNLGDQERKIDYVEDVQGKYNATVTVYKETYELGDKEYHSGDLSYVKDGKNYTRCYYDEESRDVLDWIKANTSEDATFLNW